MPWFVITLSRCPFVGALAAYSLYYPVYSNWPSVPWIHSIEDGTWIMLLVSAALLVAFSVLVVRRATAGVWFGALGASIFPILLALIPCREHLHVASTYMDWTDAGGDVAYQISVAQWVFYFGVVFSALLATVAIYGFAQCQKA